MGLGASVGFGICAKARLVANSTAHASAVDFRMVRHGVGEGIEISLCEIKTMNISSSSRLRENFQARLDALLTLRKSDRRPHRPLHVARAVSRLARAQPSPGSTFKEQGSEAKMMFHRIFRTAADCERVKRLCVPANEQNRTALRQNSQIDVLNVELRSS